MANDLYKLYYNDGIYIMEYFKTTREINTNYEIVHVRIIKCLKLNKYGECQFKIGNITNFSTDLFASCSHKIDFYNDFFELI